MEDTNSELEVGLKSQQKRPSNVKEVAELVDIISHLPDHLIARVLSFLDTKEAIRTCILSSRWRNIWRGITHIRLRGYGTNPEKFSNLVEHVLQNCITTDFLTFELNCPSSIDITCLNTWIGRIVGRKLERLILLAHKIYFDEYELPDIPLPQFILSYTTLVYLKLDFFDIQIPESVVCFPCLEGLDLHVVFPNNVVVVNRLLSSCPVLEELDMFGYVDLELIDSDEVFMKIDVSVVTLKRLSLHLKNVGYNWPTKHDVIINTPNLEYLYIADDSCTKYVVKNLQSVLNVCIDYEAHDSDPVCINHVLQLLMGSVFTEILMLDRYTIDVLGSALSNTWLIFPFLNTLILYPMDSWTYFSELLHSAPFLNLFILNLYLVNADDERPSDQWSHPDTVPKCLLGHLKTIAILEFIGKEDEIQLVEYLLNNARVLNRIMIGYGNEYRNEEVMQKLLTAPRASKNCEVEIYEKVEFENDIRTALRRVIVWGY